MAAARAPISLRRSAKLTVNRWIVGESERTVAAVTEALQAFRFNEAAAAIYHFIWHVYCDWYLELIKPILTGSDEAAAVGDARRRCLRARSSACSCCIPSCRSSPKSYG